MMMMMTTRQARLRKPTVATQRQARSRRGLGGKLCPPQRLLLQPQLQPQTLALPLSPVLTASVGSSSLSPPTFWRWPAAVVRISILIPLRASCGGRAGGFGAAAYE